mgnify:CR=1 FL=1
MADVKAVQETFLVEPYRRDGITFHVVITALWDGVRRYSCFFCRSMPRHKLPLRSFNKERYNEQGVHEASNVEIPHGTYKRMWNRACGVLLTKS